MSETIPSLDGRRSGELAPQFHDAAAHRFTHHRTGALAFCIGLLAANVAAWIWALVVFAGNIEQLEICAVVYGLGLRHAIDADHITAIDNVTRKMMQDEKRPVAVGFFFALGHSAIVILVTIAVSLATGSMGLFEQLQGLGRVISTLVSAGLLFAIAYMNVEIFRKIRRSPSGAGADTSSAGSGLLAPVGFLSRIFGPVLRLVHHSWHMFPIGLLFGLGFDTATEVAMFGVSATQAARGISFSSVLIFPILFTVGMSLIDTVDGVAMMQAYRWALIAPSRRRLYNTAITLASAITAAIIATAELVDLLGDAVSTTDWLGTATEMVQSNINLIGIVLLCFFVVAWLLSYLTAKGVFRRDRVWRG